MKGIKMKYQPVNYFKNSRDLYISRFDAASAKKQQGNYQYLKSQESPG
jgi:hypothetical protein